MSTNAWYTFFYSLVWPFVNFFHPVKAVGREHIPEGGVLLCSNHTKLSDPFLIVYAIRRPPHVRIMAKAELVNIPILGFCLRKAGIFAVERGKSDIGAIKQAMKYLKAGDKVLLFPEGTRHKDGNSGDAKTGAAMLAVRTGVPIVPIFVPAKKKWFRRTSVIIGEAYYPQTAEKKATTEEYHTIAADLMERIRNLAGRAA